MRFTSLFVRTSLWLLVVFVFLSACVGEQCETIEDPVMRVSFARYTNADRTEEQAVSVTFTAINGIGAAANAEPLVEKGASIAGLRMPLSPNENKSSFVFIIPELKDDTVWFTYTPRPYFISQACGFEMEYENLEIDKHSKQNIDTVLVIQPLVNAQRNDVNVKIYFK